MNTAGGISVAYQLNSPCDFSSAIQNQRWLQHKSAVNDNLQQKSNAKLATMTENRNESCCNQTQHKNTDRLFYFVYK